MQEHEQTPDKSSLDQQDKGTNISPQAILADATKMLQQFEPIAHDQLLNKLLEQVMPVNYRLKAFPEIPKLEEEYNSLAKQYFAADGSIAKTPEAEKAQPRMKEINAKLEKCKVTRQQYLIITVREVLRLAAANDWGMCQKHQFIYLYNSAYWSLIEDKELEYFLGEAGRKMGMSEWQAEYYQFKEALFRQFMATAKLQKHKELAGKVLINLRNGTFEITAARQQLREPRKEDFLTYQLPFNYDRAATAPMFQEYLDTVLPDRDVQNVLSEFMGYVFIQPQTLKLEKTLLLYGSGANGKSVFFEIVQALLGKENVSNYSLQSLTNENGYFRAKLANMLVNYASEISGKLQTSIFKQLVSGEPVEARLPYGEPFTLHNYGKLIFNTNELPKDVEQTDAFFRRFLIIAFNVTIPENKQDKQMAQKIISLELSGVFNWVLAGLKRLLERKCFTICNAVSAMNEEYRINSDSVLLFLKDEGYTISYSETIPLKQLFAHYRDYCRECSYTPCAMRTFSERVRKNGYATERKNIGFVVFAKK